jgi:uncharacterized membrane protein
VLRTFLVGLNAFYLLVFAAFALLLPAITRRDLLFGVTVPSGTRATPAGRAILRGYRLGVLGLTVLLAAALALLWLLAPAAWWETPWLAVLPVALALFPDIPYLLAYRAARRLAARSPQPTTAAAAAQPAPAAELVSRRYGDYVPWIWETLPLAMIALTTAYLAITYAAAPAVIPTHFDLAGNPNAYARKTIGSYFVLVWTQLFMEIFITALAVLVVGAKAVPGRADRRFRRRMLRFLYFVKVLSLAFMGILAVVIAQAALLARPQVGLPLAMSGIFVLLTLGVAFALAITTGQGGARLGPAAETATDRLADRYWKLGVIYVNRGDPSLFVEQRFGFGWTLNLGNPRALAVLVGIAVFTALFVVGIIAVATPH